MSTGTCHVSGARRFHSFDGSCFSLHGDCVYKMSEVVEKDGSMAPFVVSVQQLTKMDDAMVTRRVDIQAYKYKISMSPRVIWEIMVDDVTANLPLSLGDGKVRAYQNGINIVVVTDFGLMVTYDTVAGAIIQLPSIYKGVTGGLCGNYNDKKEDDFLLPSGLQEPSVEKFAAGWLVVQEGYPVALSAAGDLTSFCPLTCPANSHYELCADTCSSTCYSLSESPKYPLCQEGCQCSDGFVFDGGKCVLLENCGCVVDGHYYKDPCEDTECREKENCVVMNSKAICVAQSTATCRAVRLPHL
ncbi:IgGFc-binding protein-like [Oncorhynchus masou masou]|uniref:IgGFc-binding protein-like n=1 Tax=Oncorhynchus masou masou TaxID=90313 RepID=UPI0031845287